MDCILNHCHEGIAGDFNVTIFYAFGVLCMLGSAFVSRSKTIQRAAVLISAAWVYSLFAVFYIGGAAYFVLALMIDAMLAYRFWKMAQRDLFPVVLFWLVISDFLFLVAAIAIDLEAYWTIFWINRIFELTLLYIIGSSLLRARLFQAADEKQKPPTGWRAQFAVV